MNVERTAPMPTRGASAKELAEIEVALMTQHFT
jgi:hypothetical protein